MSLKIIFATGVFEETHKELAEKAKAVFNDVHLAGSRPGFVTSLAEYGTTGRAVIDRNYSPENTLIIKEIEETILKEANRFFRSAGYTYDKDRYEFRVANLWFNEMESGSNHPKHAHYGSVLSGCFYVEVPPNSGGITFYGPLARIDKADLRVEDYTIFNSISWTILPEAGNMLLWESYLQHEVPTSVFIGKRRSIAFDVSLDIKELYGNR